MKRNDARNRRIMNQGQEMDRDVAEENVKQLRVLAIENLDNLSPFAC